jgi:putative aminopeptidase FrvX
MFALNGLYYARYRTLLGEEEPVMRESASNVHPLLGDPAADVLGTCRVLSAIAAPAGNEDRLTAAVEAHLRARGLEPVVDRLAQVSVELGLGETCVLVAAHLDELALVVRAIDEDGMLRVHRVGGVPERVLPATPLVLHTRGGDLPAVVGFKSYHLTPVEERHVTPSAAELYLDIGADGRAAAEAAGVRVGDPATYAPFWAELAGGRFSGKALDDRVGVAVLLSLLEQALESPPPIRLVLGFTTQEEFHLRGGLALVARHRPDVVVNVDITPAGDTPDLAGTTPVRLGGGPVLSRHSFHGRGTLGGLLPHPSLVRAVEEAADVAATPLQYGAAVGVITDTAFLPMATAEGIAAVDVAVPCRYAHAPTETAQLSDLTACVDLLAALVPSLAAVNLSRGASQILRGGLA